MELEISARYRYLFICCYFQVFKKYGLQRYDPVNEEFDPHRHNAVFQVPDPSKPPNTVAVVLKVTYLLIMLYFK